MRLHSICVAPLFGAIFREIKLTRFAHLLHELPLIFAVHFLGVGRHVQLGQKVKSGGDICRQRKVDRSEEEARALSSIDRELDQEDADLKEGHR